MPSLSDIAAVLLNHRGRFEALDAFVDDVDELRAEDLTVLGKLVSIAPTPIFVVPVGEKHLVVELFAKRGIARFKLPDGDVPSVSGAVKGSGLGGLLGIAIGAAGDTKEGLLGGLFLGMLVGGLLGAAANETPERVLALQFDPPTGVWRLYNGPLLKWAKRTLHPSTA